MTDFSLFIIFSVLSFNVVCFSILLRNISVLLCFVFVVKFLPCKVLLENAI